MTAKTKKNKDRKVLAFYMDTNGLKTKNENPPRDVKEGETLSIEGATALYRSGFHACRDPLDVIAHTWEPQGAIERLTLVELSGDIHEGSDKLCAASKKTLKIWSPTETVELFKQLREKPEAAEKAKLPDLKALKTEANKTARESDKLYNAECAVARQQRREEEVAVRAVRAKYKDKLAAAARAYKKAAVARDRANKKAWEAESGDGSPSKKLAALRAKKLIKSVLGK